MSAPAEPARDITVTAAGRLLAAVGFQRRAWPAAPGTWIYEHSTRRHRTTIVLRRDRGHQVVIHSHWDTRTGRWHPDHEYGHHPNGHPYSIETAVRHGIQLAHPRRAA